MQETIILPTDQQVKMWGYEMAQKINAAMQSITNCFMGDAEPNPTYALMWWGQPSTNSLWQRNSNNTDWVNRGQLDAYLFGVAPAAGFRVHQAGTPNLTVVIEAGNMQNGTTKASQTAQTTSAFTAPTVNPRNDLIVVDQTTGAYTVVAGAENSSPVDPAIPSGKIAVARVRLTAGMSSITDSSIDDLRPSYFIQAQAPSSNILFDKVDSFSPAFSKTGAGTLSVKAGTSVVVAGAQVSWSMDTAVTMPTLTAGTDYAIYVCTDGTIRADANWSAPTGYTTANSRKIGGFHYGLVAAGTTVAGGSFATTGNGMIWTQADVDAIAGINQWSIWDLKYRPACSDPRGMVCVAGRFWSDIYLCSTDPGTNGTSKYNTNIASGTVLPKIPTMMGGNGTTTYPTLNWWVANELAMAYGKRLFREREFVIAAFGVTENQSIDATASTYPTALRNAGYTSKWGIEQASGHHWIWGEDTGMYYDNSTWSWKDLNGNNGAGTGRGQIQTQGTYGLSRVILGGARTLGAYSGSRASLWYLYPWVSNWHVGLRAACDHLQLD